MPETQIKTKDQELIIETVCQRLHAHHLIPRSTAYRSGVAAALRFHLFHRVVTTAFSEGTPEYDAFSFGIEEGKQAARCITVIGWNAFLDGMAGLPVTDEVQHGA